MRKLANAQGPAGTHEGEKSSGVHALCFGAVHGLTESLSERAGTPPTTRVKGASRGPRPKAYALSRQAGGCMHAKSETCGIPAVEHRGWIISSGSFRHSSCSSSLPASVAAAAKQIRASRVLSDATPAASKPQRISHKSQAVGTQCCAVSHCHSPVICCRDART